VGADELLDLRADMAAGRLELRVEGGEFALADHQRFLAENAGPIARFRARQAAAFAAERAAWEAAGEFARAESAAPGAATAPDAVPVPPGGCAVEAEFAAGVWRLAVRPGDTVAAGQHLLTLEAMKMESPVTAPVAGRVAGIHVAPGDLVSPGTTLLTLAPR
jgi:urea carboxylase